MSFQITAVALLSSTATQSKKQQLLSLNQNLKTRAPLAGDELKAENKRRKTSTSDNRKYFNENKNKFF